MKDVNYLKEKGVDIEQALGLFGNIKTYNDNIGEFLIGIQDKLDKLENYKENKDLNNYKSYIHTLKNDAKNFGFKKLETIATNQEKICGEGNLYEVIQEHSTLIKEVEQAKNIVKEYLNEKKASNQENSSNPNKRYQQKTILVADDSNIIRNFVKRIFSNQYQVGQAQNGKETIEILKANQDNDNIVAILLDLNMPEVDGFEVLEYMKENNLFQKIDIKDS